MIIQNTIIASLKGVELLDSVLGSNHPNTLQAISVQTPAEIKINEINKQNIYFCFHSQNEKFSTENFCIVLLSTVLLLIKIFIVSSSSLSLYLCLLLSFSLPLTLSLFCPLGLPLPLPLPQCLSVYIYITK